MLSVKDEVEKVVPAGLALLIRLRLSLGGLVYVRNSVFMLTLIHPAQGETQISVSMSIKYQRLVRFPELFISFLRVQ